MTVDLLVRVKADAAQAQAAFERVGAGLGRVANRGQTATGSMANLTAQFNDIGVMMASGQNPFLMAIQQGTQITQIIGPMGAAGAVRSLGAAFMGMLNPVSLITIGAIAAGAAMFQWLMGSGEQARSFDDTLSDLDDSIAALNSSAVSFSAEGLEAMRAKYGQITAEVLNMTGAQRDAAQRAAEDAAAASLTALTGSLTSGLLDVSANSEIMSMFRIVSDAEAMIDRAETLRQRPPSIHDVDTSGAQADALGGFGLTHDLASIFEESGDRAEALKQQLFAIRELDTFGAQADALGLFRQGIEAAHADGVRMEDDTEAFLAMLLVAEGKYRELATSSAAADRAVLPTQEDMAIRDDVGSNAARVAALRQVAQAEAAAAASAAQRHRADTAGAQELLAGLQAQVALQAMINQFGADSAAVAQLRAQQERAIYAEMVNSSTAAQDLKDAVMAAYDAQVSLAGVDVAGNIGAAAGEAARLAANLNAASAALGAISSAAISATVSNVGQAARLQALQAGESVADAGVTSRIAEERARSAEAFGSGDGVVRAAARQELDRLEAELREGVGLNAQITAFETALRDTGGAGAGAGGGSGGGSGGVSGLESLIQRAQAAMVALGLSVDTVAVKMDVGMLTGAEGADEVGSATRRAADALAEMIAEADAMGPAGASAAAQFRTELEGLIPQIEGAGASFQDMLADMRSSASDSISSGIAGDLKALITGTKTAGDAFSDMGQTIMDTIAGIMAQKFTERFITPLIDSLLGAIFPGAGGAAGLFGAGAGGAPRPKPRALGGPVTAGQPYMVGERGPELFMPSEMGRIVSNGAWRSAAREPSGAASRDRPSGPASIVNIHNAPAGTETRERADGNTTITDIILPMIQGAFATDARTGGPMSQAMAQTFGLQRQGQR